MTLEAQRPAAWARFAVAALLAVASAASARAQDGNDGRAALIDTHIHYSHDAWERLPPDDALAILRAAGLERAFVSSSSDEGTQKLYALAPDFIVPVLRPYRKRGELSSWMHDDSVVAMLEEKLPAGPYAGIGEFHVFGADADLPVVRAVVRLAGRYGIFLHAHSDAEAVERMFAQDPGIRILWAHSGFTDPQEIRRMLEKYPNLQADLAFRSEFARGGTLVPAWRSLFLDFPDRFMIGTDTYTPERWYAVEDNAEFSRRWLADLPAAVAEKIGRANAATLAEGALANWAAAGGPDGACGGGAAHGAIAMAGKRFHANVVPDPPSIAVGAMFAAEITACDADGNPFDGEVAIDATMPAHGHGMNTGPEVAKTGPGRFRAEGLMVHMPGAWRIRLQLNDGTLNDSLEAEIRVE